MYYIQPYEMKRLAGSPKQTELDVIIKRVSGEDEDEENKKPKRPLSPNDKIHSGKEIIDDIEWFQSRLKETEWIDGDAILTKGKIALVKKNFHKMKFTKRNLHYACRSGNLKLVQ